MDNVVSIFLVLLCITQAIERYFYQKSMNKQLSECLKASMSRNMNEFLSATTPQSTPDRKFTENEEVLLEDANDELYDKFIKQS